MRDYLPVVLPFIALFKIFRRLTSQPEFRGLIIVEVVLLASGTVFYHYTEQWTWLDAIYFCVVTLATVGYGDLSPTTAWGKAFAIPYIIIGVAMLGVFIQIAGRTALQEIRDRDERKRLKGEAPQEATEGG
jgi:predicted membrane protein